ncbi:hypothetical protein B0J13DRAFT_663409 [Dactylonectria estremocensis]|uniref:Uncharacterized protein n=1 Tax=Dactylonectria estremocensis TaxID=1079267 RepID=A0A9P9EXI3_9HYPO|nr:hypothetical protein B0J13DRAFT_663409 [Dactylonectria estremocensis]
MTVHDAGMLCAGARPHKTAAVTCTKAGLERRQWYMCSMQYGTYVVGQMAEHSVTNAPQEQRPCVGALISLLRPFSGARRWKMEGARGSALIGGVSDLGEIRSTGHLGNGHPPGRRRRLLRVVADAPSALSLSFRGGVCGNDTIQMGTHGHGGTARRPLEKLRLASSNPPRATACSQADPQAVRACQVHAGNLDSGGDPSSLTYLAAVLSIRLGALSPPNLEHISLIDHRPSLC